METQFTSLSTTRSAPKKPLKPTKPTKQKPQQQASSFICQPLSQSSERDSQMSRKRIAFADYSVSKPLEPIGSSYPCFPSANEQIATEIEQEFLGVPQPPLAPSNPAPKETKEIPKLVITPKKQRKEKPSPKSLPKPKDFQITLQDKTLQHAKSLFTRLLNRDVSRSVDGLTQTQQPDQREEEEEEIQDDRFSQLSVLIAQHTQKQRTQVLQNWQDDEHQMLQGLVEPVSKRVCQVEASLLQLQVEKRALAKLMAQISQRIRQVEPKAEVKPVVV